MRPFQDIIVAAQNSFNVARKVQISASTCKTIHLTSFENCDFRIFIFN